MENIKIKKAGRPPLKLDNTKKEIEIQKYLNGEQSGVQTYRNLKIGKTSFYRLLSQMEVKR